MMYVATSESGIVFVYGWTRLQAATAEKRHRRWARYNTLALQLHKVAQNYRVIVLVLQYNETFVFIYIMC